MSDYFFLMESRLSREQLHVVQKMQEDAKALGMNLYLVGGAIRDLTGGFPIGDLNFVVEGNPLKLVRGWQRQGVRVERSDEALREAEVKFPSGVRATVSMARTETYTGTAASPTIAPATIAADLRRRDFTMNAIGVSMNPQSRGLLLDPTNGLVDIENREIRTLHNYSFIDDPVRMFRAVRFRARLGFVLEPRTQSQFENARNGELHFRASGKALVLELQRIAREPEQWDVLKALEKEKLLAVLHPRLQGPGLNSQGFSKAGRIARSLAQAGLHAQTFGLFHYLLTRKLREPDRKALMKRLNLKKPESELAVKLEAATRRLSKELRGKAAGTPSVLYRLLAAAPPDAILLLILESPQKTIQTRIKTFLQKQLPLRFRLPERELTGMGVPAGTAASQKILAAWFFETLDGKLKSRSDQVKFLKKLAEKAK